MLGTKSNNQIEKIICVLSDGARPDPTLLCRYLQPNHFGVLALPVGEFLGLLHDAVYVGSCAVDGDLRRSTSGGSPQSADAGTPGAGGRVKPAADAQPSHQFFAQGEGSSSSVRACSLHVPPVLGRHARSDTTNMIFSI